MLNFPHNLDTTLRWGVQAEVVWTPPIFVIPLIRKKFLAPIGIAVKH